MQLQKRLVFLLDTIREGQHALRGLLSGEIQSYNLGTWSVTRTKPDMDKLAKLLSDWQREADGIQNILTGRPMRRTTTTVYINPQNTRWWW